MKRKLAALRNIPLTIILVLLWCLPGQSIAGSQDTSSTGNGRAGTASHHAENLEKSRDVSENRYSEEDIQSYTRETRQTSGRDGEDFEEPRGEKRHDRASRDNNSDESDRDKERHHEREDGRKNDGSDDRHDDHKDHAGKGDRHDDDDDHDGDCGGRDGHDDDCDDDEDCDEDGNEDDHDGDCDHDDDCDEDDDNDGDGNNTNNPPAIVSVPVLTGAPGTVYQYDVNGQDPDQDILTYSIVAGPEGLQIDPASGVLTWATPVSGTFTIIVKVDDGRRGSAEQSYDLLINSPPLFTSDPALVHQVGSAYSYQAVAFDPDNDVLQYALLASPQGMVIDPAGGQVSWESPLPGEYSINLQVVDSRGGSDSQSYTLFVNGPPSITSEPIVVHSAGVAYEYQVVASDPNNDTLVYSLAAGPSGLLLDETSGLLTWISPLPGEYAVTIRVTDNRGGSDEQSYSLFVNGPPDIVSEAPLSHQAGSAYLYQVIAVDPNSDSLTYEVTASPDGLQIDSATGLITWENPVPGEYSLEVRVDDGRGGNDTQSWTLFVNGPPVIISIPIVEHQVGSAYQYQVVAKDPNNDIPAFELLNSPQGMEIDPASGLVNWQEPRSGEFSVSVRADDQRGGSALQEYVLRVNAPPVITSSPIMELQEGAPYAYQVIAADENNDPLTYELLAAPGEMNQDPVSGLITWNSTVSEEYQVTTRVSDGRGGSDEQTFTLAINGPPRISSKPVLSQLAGDSYAYQVIATDPNNDELKYSLTEGPEGLAIDQQTGLVSWAAPLSGEYPVTILVEDRRGGSDQQNYILRIIPRPTVDISADPAGIILGESSRLFWTSTDADTVTIDQGIGIVAANSGNEPGSGKEVSPETTTTYTLTATGLGGTASAATTVTVTIPEPTVTLGADPASVLLGSSATLAWNSTHAETCTLAPGIGPVDCNGTTVVTPAETTSYTLTATGTGGTASASTTVTVTIPEPTATLSADPASVVQGSSSTLAWNSTHAETCTLAPGIGPVDCNGTTVVTPDATTSYTLTATGPGGTASASTTVTVTIPAPVVALDADPGAIEADASATLSWSSVDADICVIEPGIGNVNCKGTRGVEPAATTTYTITATGPGGTATDTATVAVTHLPPTVDITADPATINLGEQTRLFWHSAHAETVVIDQEIGAVALNSSDPGPELTVAPEATITYTITATGPGGMATASVTVTVHTASPPTITAIAEPEQIDPGQGSWLYWHSTNADTVTIDQNIGTVAANGCTGGGGAGYPGIVPGGCGEGVPVTPQATTTYTLTATGAGGTATATVTVTVRAAPLPTVDIVAAPETILRGEASWLTWHSTNADTVTISQGIGAVPANTCVGGGELEPPSVDCSPGYGVMPEITTTYTITATGPGGTATDAVTVTVELPPVDLTPPTVEIIAAPPTIRAGEETWLLWRSTNAESVSINQGLGTVAANGCYGGGNDFPPGSGGCDEGKPVSPQTTTTYTIIAAGPGGTATASVTVTVQASPPPTVEIISEFACINPDGTSWLYWHSTDATTVTIDQGIGVVALNGCYGYYGEGEVNGFPLEGEGTCSHGVPVSPSSTMTYTITATGPGGAATTSITVKVGCEQPPAVDLYAFPPYIGSGESTLLLWNTTHADTFSLDQGIGQITPLDCYNNGDTQECSGEVEVAPAVTTTYTLTATGPGGTATDHLTIHVDDQLSPSVDIYASPAALNAGESTWLYWSSFNADTISLDQGIGTVTPESCDAGECWGGLEVSPNTTTTYTITATGPNGTVTHSVTINVAGSDLSPTARLYPGTPSISQGESTSLHWETTNADAVVIDQGIGPVPLQSDAGGLNITPDQTTTYTLTATGPSGQVSVSVTVIVLDPLPPLVDLIAWPETIELGRDVTLAWSSASADAVTITASPGGTVGDLPLQSGANGPRVTPGTSTTYTITATGPGGVATDSVTVNVLPKIEISTCEQPALYGDPCTLAIRTVNGDTVEVDQGVGAVTMQPGAPYEHTGTVTINPVATTVYTVTATGNGGTSTATVTIRVAPKVDFQTDREIIELGSQAFLHWTVLGADSVTINPGLGGVEPSSGPAGQAVTPGQATSYTLTATGPGAEPEVTRATVRVHVNDFSRPPVVNLFEATPATIDPGESALLQWETANMQQARIDHGIGDVPQFGTIQVTPRQTTTYILTVRGPKGFVTATATVQVRGTYDEGSFGDRYRDLVPEDSTTDIPGERFSLLTGRCADRDGTPLAGVRVSILGQQQFGSVRTDSQGVYSLPVIGSARYTVVLTKTGFLPVHRKATVLNNRIGVVETAALLQPEPPTPLLESGVGSEAMLFHAGQLVSDGRGERRLALTLTMGALSGSPELTTTEYVMTSVLPAELPPATAYGYAAEIGDGVDSLAFAAPVTAWVDNFLGFAIGQTVPVGWYDREKGEWIPRANGRVVLLLDADTDGTVDGLDITGDGQADDLNGNGATSDEVAGLPPGEMQAGASYFRFGVDRTGAWACAWPHAPLEATAPSPPPPSHDLASCPGGDCSLVQQEILIPGTEFTLHYSEARVPAYQPKITIPVTGETVPAEAEGGLVRMTVAGRVFTESFPLEPNRTVRFTWDGRDHLGYAITGPVVAEIAIGYHYQRDYGQAGGFNHAFGQTGQGTAGVAARAEYIAWQKSQLQLERHIGAEDFIAEGWSLSPHHQVNLIGLSSLHLGSGALQAVDNRWATHTVLKGRSAMYSIFGRGNGIGVDDAGQLVFLSDADKNVLWGLNANETFYPSNPFPIPFAGHYDPTHPYQLNDPAGIAIDGAGKVHYAERGSHLLRYGSAGNYLGGTANYHVFAGNGQSGYAGDGGPALSASFAAPDQMALDHWGNLYVADSGNHVIRRISADGIVETIAGNGLAGSDGDEGPALAAAISPEGIAVDNQGNIYLAEPSYHKVRRIDVSGTIGTVAGTGIEGGAGLNGPAGQAQLYGPCSVGVDSLGNLYIGDSNRLLTVGSDSILRRIRWMAVAGVLTTDLQGRLYVNDPWLMEIYRLSRPGYGDLPRELAYSLFQDQADLNHYFSAIGKHLATASVFSGVTHPTWSFVYDLDNLLVEIRNSKGETILFIHRDAEGKVLSLETAAGQTSLTVDHRNHLTEVRFPENGSVSMGYSDQGLLTEFFPNFFGTIQGTVTERGSGAPLPDVIVTLTSGNGSHTALTDAGGGYAFPGIEAGPYTLEWRKPGYFSQSVTATLPLGRGSMTHNVSLLAHPALALQIDAPASDALLNSPAVKVRGRLSHTARVTVNGMMATVNSDTFSADLTLPGEGRHTITALAEDGYGQTASAEVVVAYYRPPTVSLAANKETVQPGEPVTLSWSSTNSTTCRLEPLGETVACNGTKTVNPAATTTYTLHATGPGGSAATAVAIEVRSLLSLAINAPAAGATVHLPEITVTGTLASQVHLETGVTVNGMPAQVNGNRFFANAVRLVEGENTITATARDTAGNTATASTTVVLDTSANNDWIELLVNPASGVAPLTTTLTVNQHLAFTPDGRPRFGYSGPDQIEFTWVSNTELNLTFSTPGVYTLIYEVDDPEGNPVRAETMVNVLDRTQLDALLQAKWEGMKAALRGGDIEGALAYHYPSVKEDYRAIYNSLGNRLSGLIDQMQEIQLVFVEEGRAQYRIMRNITMTGTAETVSFYIYFYIDNDGIWRIENY